MNLMGPAALKNRGSSLIETVIAMGTLAIAIPLVFGAIAESGKSSMSSEAETRSTWIIPTCMVSSPRPPTSRESSRKSPDILPSIDSPNL